MTWGGLFRSLFSQPGRSCTLRRLFVGIRLPRSRARGSHAMRAARRCLEPVLVGLLLFGSGLIGCSHSNPSGVNPYAPGPYGPSPYGTPPAVAPAPGTTTNPYGANPYTASPYGTPPPFVPPTTSVPPPGAPASVGSPYVVPPPGSVPGSPPNPEFQWPEWGNPGTINQQQQRAVVHDPYGDNDAGPKIEGGRPREFEKPLAQPVRSNPLGNLRWPF